MQEWLISEVFSLLLTMGVDIFRGFFGNLRKRKLKKNLKKALFQEILSNYGDEVYYNDLDHFLSVNRVIYNMIWNAGQDSPFRYQSKSWLMNYYLQKFVEEYPQHLRYYGEIREMLRKCIEVVFITLNEFPNEEVRVLGKLMMELSGEIFYQVEAVQEGIDGLRQKLDVLVEQTQSNRTEFYHKEYLEYVSRLYSEGLVSGRIERKLYAKDEEEHVDILDALLKDRNVLLLGEAGYGKTYESLELLVKIGKDARTSERVAFYLPLHEYGVLYQDIFSGIIHKMSPFCIGSAEELVKAWLVEGKLVLILDGMDDISEEAMRTKLIADAKNIMLQYHKNHMLITGRSNRYHGERNHMKQYSLTGLDESTIRKKMQEEGIWADIPRSYYQLFANPLLFNVGKLVLKKHYQREFFNRSVLFDELTAMLYEDWDKQKGLSGQKMLSRAEALTILGKLAYQTFERPFYSILEFEQEIDKLVPGGNKALTINSLIGSGLLKVSDRVMFAHKLFKEYCTAYYLISELPLEENRRLYLDLMKREEWKEVFVFASGMFRTLETQDAFLDFIMENNLALYVECVNAKGDLNPYHAESDYLKLAERYLRQILHTYTGIISRYFGPLERYFDPKPGRWIVDPEAEKTCITGCLDSDGKWLRYWFTREAIDVDEVTCLMESRMEGAHSNFRARARQEGRSIRYSSINLALSGMEGDSGRKIAINRVKSELKEILEKRRLKESKYLLCETINEYRKKVDKLRDESDLLKMQEIVEGMIEEVMKDSPNISGYSYNQVDMFKLRDMLREVNAEDVDFSACILPEEDLRLPKNGGAWVWDLYSKEQKEKRISNFFYFHQLSYLEMVEKNFPNLCQQFGRYQDIPYQVVVRVRYREQEEVQSFRSEPELCYYYLAAESGQPMHPILVEVEERADYRVVWEEICQSYLRQGRIVRRTSMSETGFTFTTSTNRYGNQRPLTEYVYDSIESSLEEILGKI